MNGATNAMGKNDGQAGGDENGSLLTKKYEWITSRKEWLLARNSKLSIHSK